MKIENVFKNNKKWVASKLEVDANYFQKLSEAHDPNWLYIGCSDSRVVAEELMGAKPGELFVHRNIANIVSTNDTNGMSVINYAVNHLKVNNIIICGHYDCGGIKAVMHNKKPNTLDTWLQNIQELITYNKKELEKFESEEDTYKRLVELNVEAQCKNVLTIKSVQDAIQNRNLKVYGWVFDIHNGKLINLNLDFLK